MTSIQMQFLSDAAREAYSEKNYGSEHSAGFDLRAMIDDVIYLDSTAQTLIPTGIKINLMPLFRDDYSPTIKLAAFIFPRSGRGSKEGLVLGNTVGLIDPDYLGEIMVCAWARPMFNGQPIQIKPNERIAQLVIGPVFRPEIQVVDAFDKKTERGENGFGSTGQN